MKNKILLVEDEKTTGKFLKKALEYKDFDVLWVTHGNEAVLIMEKGKFDLVILDLKLPDIPGEKVLELIRKKDPYVYVFVNTNYEEPPVMKKLINYGVDKYINKGGNADLWQTVNLVKEKLDPFTDEERESVLDSIPEDIFKDTDHNFGDK